VELKTAKLNRIIIIIIIIIMFLYYVLVKAQERVYNSVDRVTYVYECCKFMMQ